VGDLIPPRFRVGPPETPRPQPVRDPVGASLRLIGWGWVLLRHDALVPRELEPWLPGWARRAMRA